MQQKARRAPDAPASAQRRVEVAVETRAPERAVPVTFRRATRLSVGRDQILNLVELLLDPLVLALSLWAVAWAIEGELGRHNVILSVIVFALTFPGSSRLTTLPWRVVRNIAMGWLTIFGLLLVFGWGSRYLQYFERETLTAWFWIAPLSQASAHFLLRAAAPAIRGLQGHTRRVVLAGMNAPGVDLARRLTEDVYASVNVLGFFDDRDGERLEHRDQYTILGRLADLPEYVKRNGVDVIYLSLPMASQARIIGLLEALRDTTASIYFVPDTFVTDLIQGRMDAVNGAPVVSVCESPFTGLNGAIKRASDVVLTVLILAALAPLLVLIALGVKLTSPGPVIFRQRRYGLDGREIVVYKFRSMTVLEDGDSIEQARRDDPRFTAFGRFLRSTSLDELPQFFNVLQGRMSIVGPRPHAVAHNEQYRKLIKGYMVRHKVRPGITGWAQVNGYRGETETLEKMKARIDCDLEYLRNWSLRLDLFIIAKTAWILLRPGSAH
jgi:putative colanic acid biosynthesis UDP-glucose lipid carrier transferase